METMSRQQQQIELQDKARQVKLLVLDVDGVLTDGKLYFSDQGNEFKAFCTLDGQGIKLLQDSGVKVALISGRQSHIVTQRANNLAIDDDLVFQGREDKLAALDSILASMELNYADVAYIGDDLPDLACIRKVGLALTVPDAHSMVKEYAHYETSYGGGHGAVREVCDWILRAQGNYDDAIAPYL